MGLEPPLIVPLKVTFPLVLFPVVLIVILGSDRITLALKLTSLPWPWVAEVLISPVKLIVLFPEEISRVPAWLLVELEAVLVLIFPRVIVPDALMVWLPPLLSEERLSKMPAWVLISPVVLVKLIVSPPVIRVPVLMVLVAVKLTSPPVVAVERLFNIPAAVSILLLLSKVIFPPEVVISWVVIFPAAKILIMPLSVVRILAKFTSPLALMVNPEFARFIGAILLILSPVRVKPFRGIILPTLSLKLIFPACKINVLLPGVIPLIVLLKIIFPLPVLPVVLKVIVGWAICRGAETVIVLPWPVVAEVLILSVTVTILLAEVKLIVPPWVFPLALISATLTLPAASIAIFPPLPSIELLSRVPKLLSIFPSLLWRLISPPVFVTELINKSRFPDMVILPEPVVVMGVFSPIITLFVFSPLFTPSIKIDPVLLWIWLSPNIPTARLFVAAPLRPWILISPLAKLLIWAVLIKRIPLLSPPVPLPVPVKLTAPVPDDWIRLFPNKIPCPAKEDELTPVKLIFPLKTSILGLSKIKIPWLSGVWLLLPTKSIFPVAVALIFAPPNRAIPWPLFPVALLSPSKRISPVPVETISPPSPIKIPGLKAKPRPKPLIKILPLVVCTCALAIKIPSLILPSPLTPDRLIVPLPVVEISAPFKIEIPSLLFPVALLFPLISIIPVPVAVILLLLI